MGLLFPESPLDDLDMNILDASVAGGAGGGHSVVRDAGSRVGMREDVVGRMTGRTDSRDGQSRSEKPLPMDGHGVVLQDVILRDVVRPRNWTALPMTLPAEEGDVHGGGGRCRVPM